MTDTLRTNERMPQVFRATDAEEAAGYRDRLPRTGTTETLPWKKKGWHMPRPSSAPSERPQAEYKLGN